MFSIWHEVFVTWQSFWKQGRSISEMSFYGKIVTINEHTVFFKKKNQRVSIILAIVNSSCSEESVMLNTTIGSIKTSMHI